MQKESSPKLKIARVGHLLQTRVYDLLSRNSCLVRAAPCRRFVRDVLVRFNRVEAAVRACIPVPHECTDWLDRSSPAMAPASTLRIPGNRRSDEKEFEIAGSKKGTDDEAVIRPPKNQTFNNPGFRPVLGTLTP